MTNHHAPHAPTSVAITLGRRARVTLGWTQAGAWIGVTRTGPHPQDLLTVLHPGSAQETLAKVAAGAQWPALPQAPDPDLVLQAGDVIILEQDLCGQHVDATLESVGGQCLGHARAATFTAALAQLRLTARRGD